MPQPDREWEDAQEKLELEGRCRNCRRTNYLEKAHIIGRKHDQPRTCAVCDGTGHKKDGSQCGRCKGRGETKKLWVNPLHIVPLCDPPLHLLGEDEIQCHTEYDARRLDLLSVLEPEEQAEAVLLAGGIMNALRRIEPSMFTAERTVKFPAARL